jgi:hypothetical protein
MPVFIIPSNPVFEAAIGFSAGRYPNYQIITDNDDENKLIKYSLVSGGSVYPPTIDNNYLNSDGFSVFTSSSSPRIQTAYKQVYYKPSNPGFAKQGGVSSSEVTSRSRYQAITNNAASFYSAFGSEVANALSYGVPSNGYTIKDKIGYPNNSTPVFSKYRDEPIKCPVTHLRSG